MGAYRFRSRSSVHEADALLPRPPSTCLILSTHPSLLKKMVPATPSVQVRLSLRSRHLAHPALCLGRDSQRQIHIARAPYLIPPQPRSSEALPSTVPSIVEVILLLRHLPLLPQQNSPHDHQLLNSHQTHHNPQATDKRPLAKLDLGLADEGAPYPNATPVTCPIDLWIR